MPTLLIRAFRAPDLRKKILFTLGVIGLFRFGQILPAPGVNVVAVRECLRGTGGGFADMLQLFSGGAMLKLSVFALGIIPYITASILVQLLTVMVPRLAALRKEGSRGQARITQYTRYLTVALAVLQATTVVAMARTGGIFPTCRREVLYDAGPAASAVVVVTMVAGTCVVMRLGELITDRGVGNGMSMLIFVQVVAVFPSYVSTVFVLSPFALAAMLLSGVVLVAAVVAMEQAQRRIPVQYAKRTAGRRMYGGTSTYLPLKVNQAGIVPVIFASSLISLPQLATQAAGGTGPVAEWVAYHLASGSHPVYVAAYLSLITAFTYFYVSITFDPVEVAENMKRYGGFVPGIRPGRPTAEYLRFTLSRLTAPGAAYLAALSLIPIIAFVILRDPATQQNFPFGGTTVLIMVGVGLETVKQVEAQLEQRAYTGFLRGSPART
ncbi:preprotein translocase subunit SecY [Planomonospora venezuelensis]|uniref:Protein translocase subunit SecY n=1 Tax=Planomonospora venezuelensis TaxID=1999 RepID=A0A841CT34_PLAVE|nr:preprotein translocase subunit SecY [Planomonospora venezuelensis]MBB5960971.1 preprotein translocase subunit SecY [Planomonospora venezuelensis]GIN01205.1 protein translocase subunit SecY [Planomonospora venezuelensis]